MTVTAADVEQRLAEIPGRSLRALWRRAALDLGTLPQPPGTVHREVSIAIAAAPPLLNQNAVRSHWKGFHAAKKDWQGQLVRELDGLDLDRPIRSVGRDGASLEPVFSHLVVSTPGGNRADSDNLAVLAKAYGDALTGLPDEDREVYVDHARYVAGWLDQDNDRHLLRVLEVQAGAPRTTVRLVWDEPAGPCMA